METNNIIVSNHVYTVSTCEFGRFDFWTIGRTGQILVFAAFFVIINLDVQDDPKISEIIYFIFLNRIIFCI